MGLSAGYLAGLFDGEGGISLSGPLHPKFRDNLVISIGICNREVIEIVQKQFPGRFYIKNVDKHNHSVCYSIHWHGKNCIPFLEYIENHLILKKRVAGLCIQLAQLQGKVGGRLHPEVKKHRQEVAGKIQSLIRKGCNGRRM